MNRIAATAEVYRVCADLNDWVVWALHPDGDGGILETIFSGPDAESRALEYADLKFGAVLLHAPEQRPYRQSRSHDVDGRCRSSTRGANLRLVR